MDNVRSQCDEMTPALVSLRFAISNDLPGRRGRPQCNLLTTLLKYLSDRNFILKTLSDLDTLRVLAFDRRQWRRWFSEGDLLIGYIGVIICIVFLIISRMLL